MIELEIHPVDAARVDALRPLFQAQRATRHCWCMAFCSTRGQFALGWYGGGNRRRFEAMATAAPTPMGVVALHEDEPVGWCACGPRARYVAGVLGRSGLLAERPRHEDHRVWLIACIFVRPDFRGSGAVDPLLRGAVAQAGRGGATAVEAWPLASGVRRVEDLHVGREGAFRLLGFRCIDRPKADRVIMRMELSGEVPRLSSG